MGRDILVSFTGGAAQNPTQRLNRSVIESKPSALDNCITHKFIMCSITNNAWVTNIRKAMFKVFGPRINAALAFLSSYRFGSISLWPLPIPLWRFPIEPTTYMFVSLVLKYNSTHICSKTHPTLTHPTLLPDCVELRDEGRRDRA